MEIIKATNNDLDQIMEIIADAKNLLKQSGSLQWNTPDGYPNQNTFIKDIEEGICYICKESDIVCGVYALQHEIDHNYDVIYDGNWITAGNNYLSIHRIAVKSNYYHSSVTKLMMDYAVNHAIKLSKHSIRVDTHELNKPMQGLLLKSNYEQVGIIYLLTSNIDNKRLAFELKIKR